eukprot:g21216.t1
MDDSMRPELGRLRGGLHTARQPFLYLPSLGGAGHPHDSRVGLPPRLDLVLPARKEAQRGDGGVDRQEIYPGKGVVMYPEGTRSVSLEGLPLKPGGLVSAHKLGWPLQIVITTNKEFILAEKACVLGCGVNCVSAVSAPLYPSEQETPDAFIQRVKEVWDATRGSLWDAGQDADETYELDAVADLAIWVKSSIQFVGMAPDKVWSTETDHAYPEPGYNLFTVRDLLLLCDPTPVPFEEISKLGAAIEVQFVWNCHINNDKCKPEVKVRRLDTLFDEAQFGYFFNDAEYISEDERFLKKVNGVRIFLRTVGVGHRLSVIKLVMKASTAGTLLTVAPLIADLLMLQALALRKRYFARKYEVSPDFSEYMVQLMAKKEEENRLPGMLAEDRLRPEGHPLAKTGI